MGVIRPVPRLIKSSRDGEKLAAEWMEWLGLRGIHLTRTGTDRGVDVVAAGALAQVKVHSKPVSRPVLQQLWGECTRSGCIGLVFALDRFTADALRWAEDVDIALFVFTRDGQVGPANRRARKVFADADSRSDERPVATSTDVPCADLSGQVRWRRQLPPGCDSIRAVSFGCVVLDGVRGHVADLTDLSSRHFGVSVDDATDLWGDQLACDAEFPADQPVMVAKWWPGKGLGCGALAVDLQSGSVVWKAKLIDHPDLPQGGFHAGSSQWGLFYDQQELQLANFRTMNAAWSHRIPSLGGVDIFGDLVTHEYPSGDLVGMSFCCRRGALAPARWRDALRPTRRRSPAGGRRVRRRRYPGRERGGRCRYVGRARGMPLPVRQRSYRHAGSMVR